MEYNGKRIGFKRTVGAVSELTKMAPNGDVSRLGELFSDKNLGVTLDNTVKFLTILNKWYEKSLVFENKGYTPDPVPEDFFFMLEPDQLLELSQEAMRQFGIDDEVTVEAEEIKKNVESVTTK